MRQSTVQLEQIAPEALEPIPASSLTGFRELVCTLNGTPEILLESVGIHPALLDRRDGTIPVASLATLLENGAQTLRCLDFGMRLAGYQDAVRLFSPLDRLIYFSPTLFHALDSTIAHGQGYSSAIRYSRISYPERKLYAQRYHLPGDGLPFFRQLIELILLLSQNAISYLSGGLIRAHEIWFSHPRISPHATYRSRFGAMVKFGQDFNALFFADADLHAKLLHADSDLFAAEQSVVAANFPRPAETFEARVREAIKFKLLEGQCDRDVVARRLKVSITTLHRKLRATHRSFEGLRDEARRNLAFRYLVGTNLPFTEIAIRLGYAEAAVFSRACGRWFGSAPGALRRDLTGQMPVDQVGEFRIRK